LIEAVIVLPVLILLLAGVVFLRERYLGRQHALLEARRCAWAHAMNGCGAPPDGCATAIAVISADTDDQDAVAIMDAARARADSDIDVFADVPILGAAISGLFGTQTGAQAEVEVPLPGHADRYEIERAEVVVLCNERPQDVMAAAQSVFCKRVPLLPCGKGTP
jgi:hypothetical protein